MLKQDKERIVAELTERLRAAETLIVADYRGLTHKELDGLRTRLLESGARLTVVKNTLTRRAAEAAGVEALLEHLTGPTAIAFVHDGDMVAAAKALDETARQTRRLELKGGVLAGRAVGQDDVKQLASLPPVDVLRGQVLGAVVAPLTGVLGLVSAPLTDLVGLIEARIEQLGPGAATAEPVAAEPEPEAQPEASEANEETTDQNEAPAAEEPEGKDEE
ncbi:MAG: 50S ribosomal protein L10 [Thermoleophilia bacterium]|nr:50S ribosomal protein L10 [Thermoleophilia bacterium]